MRVGIPTEIKNNENRVAITPAGVHELVRRGHEVFIQVGAGVGSGFTDAAYIAEGAKMLATAEEVWAKGDLLLKVKEPIAAEYPLLRKDQVLFTYLHLAASRPCTDALVNAGTTAIAYETVQLPNRALPLLQPMSEVAGRLSAQIGAYQLMKNEGGPGVLMGGVPGAPKAKVVVIGGGYAHPVNALRLSGYAGRFCRIRKRTIGLLMVKPIPSSFIIIRIRPSFLTMLTQTFLAFEYLRILENCSWRIR